MRPQQEDTRSVAELIAAAIREWEAERDGKGSDWQAISVLMTRGTREVLDAALALCGSPDATGREVGALILGQLGSPERTFPEECCDALIGLLRDENLDVVESALTGLGHLGNSRCEPQVIALKDHPDEGVRFHVAAALYGTETPEGIRTLLELMDDPFDVARDWATFAIAQMPEIDGPEIRDALLRRAADPDIVTRGEALKGLALRGDARGLPILIAELVAAHIEEGYLFDDAARDFLRVGEEVGSQELLTSLRAMRTEQNKELPA